MFRTTINPTNNRIFLIRFEDTEPVECEAPDFLQAFAFWLGEFKEALQNVEVEIGGGVSNQLVIWIGTQMTTITDITDDIDNAADYVVADNVKPMGRKHGKRKRRTRTNSPG